VYGRPSGRGEWSPLHLGMNEKVSKIREEKPLPPTQCRTSAVDDDALKFPSCQASTKQCVNAADRGTHRRASAAKVDLNGVDAAHKLRPCAHKLRPPAHKLRPPAHKLRPCAHKLRPCAHKLHTSCALARLSCALARTSCALARTSCALVRTSCTLARTSCAQAAPLCNFKNFRP